MTESVVEVGPGTIRGLGDADEELVAAALECIDDELALIDEHPVAVPAVWRELFRSLLPDAVETVALVCPSWWSPPRVDRAHEAAAASATNVIVLQRTQVLAHGMSPAPIVVEIAPEFVVVAREGSVIAVEPRSGRAEDVADAVANAIRAPDAVLVDTPDGVHGACAVGAAIAARLRIDRVAVTIAHQDRVLAGAAAVLRDRSGPVAEAPRSRRQRRPAVAVTAGALLSVAALCVGFVVGRDEDAPAIAQLPMTLLVEGRVAVKVPAQWSVQRITAGPGSARVQVISPDAETAVHVTQSEVPADETQGATAETLRKAIEEEPPGVFGDFNPDDLRADRPAVTYREIRERHHIHWAVFVDDTVRIGVGCQSAPGREQTVQYVCDEAVQSAHAIFTNSGNQTGADAVEKP